MKVPASLADLGIAALMVYAFRVDSRSGPWSTAAIVLLHPAVIDVSAWWGQYESIYLLTALAALVFALNGRNGLAAAALALAVMTKPQALPFLLPFAAWFWAHGGWREIVRTAAIGLAVIVVVWLPFVGGRRTGGLPAATWPSTRTRSSRSCRCRRGTSGGSSRSPRSGRVTRPTTVAVLGPITFRHIGFVITGLLSLVVAVADPARPAAADVHPRASRRRP